MENGPTVGLSPVSRSVSAAAPVSEAQRLRAAEMQRLLSSLCAAGTVAYGLEPAEKRRAGVMVRNTSS